MRKILRYSSLEWDETQWKKQITWGDLDLTIYRGSKIDEEGTEFRAYADNHTMFALVSKITTAKIILVPTEGEMEPKEIRVNKGGVIQVGNGFVYFDTRLVEIK